jgi:hypothetical protein
MFEQAHWEAVGLLGLSLGKVIFTVLIIIVIWKGFSMISRLQQAQKGGEVRDQAKRPARRRDAGAVELVQCPACGAYHDPRVGCSCRHPGGDPA